MERKIKIYTTEKAVEFFIFASLTGRASGQVWKEVECSSLLQQLLVFG